MEEPMKIKHFTVEGRGAFPLDMLRYDNCWPSTGQDVVNMESRELRKIRLSTVGPSSPTVGRWESFMWYVRKDPRT
jgi:hypothetical protein